MFISELFESITRTTIVILPGRFQPWHKGHKAVYGQLCKQYGANNAYICTSNKVDPPRSPFNFQEKLQMMQLTGVNSDHVVETIQPYNPVELTGKYDAANTVAVFAVSEKDMAEDPRFKFANKKDGSPSYFQPMPSNVSLCKTLDQHAYIVTTPTYQFSVLGKPMNSATEIRSKYENSDEQTRKAIIKDLFGNYSDSVYAIMNEKLVNTVAESSGGTSSAGISTVIGGNGGKNKSQIGSLFGGTYKQTKRKAK